ncbi:MAG: NYN domain-containing protein [Comamonadaceae bacterium]|uniref:NYN domain-containing protein n=1 Tax=Candidatus Skiveiella danica TaxID=3386177 RepID=UPI00390B48C8|nr:NYN domain-containing protein [Comamonadaceae bacterium]
MASSPDTLSMALFCDFENVALGVRDAKYEKFDIKPVLERLLLKGSIVVKKAYCDWDRYKAFKATMHEANFELIEIPHVRQSGKNSADIRLVVDALDLCYTKSHVNTFVIISGDSDFSPLVSKLRENAKQVIGVGVKNSTSDLLIANCDEFIFYDDLVREKQRATARRQPADEQPAPRRAPEEERARREDQERRRLAGVEIAVETFEALVAERGDSGKIWASVLKEAIKRRNPGFSEGAYGFRSFGNLLEEAQALRLLAFGRDEKSGAYVFRHSGPNSPTAGTSPSQPPAAPPRAEGPAERPPSRYFQQEPAAATPAPASATEPGTDGGERDDRTERGDRGERGRRGRRRDATPADIAAAAMNDDANAAADATDSPAAPEPDAGAQQEPPTNQGEPRRRSRGGRKSAGRAAAPDDASLNADPFAPSQTVAAEPQAAAAESGAATEPLGKPVARLRRPRKAASKPENS